MDRPIENDVPARSLGQFDEQWTKTSASPDESYSDIPDGIYDAVIEDARVTETASTGRPLVIWTLRIKGPQAVDRVVSKNQVVTENTLAFLKKDLEKCGIAVSRLSELPSRLKELVEHPIGIEKRTKDGRANVYFRWKATRPAENRLSDNDIPF